MEMQRKRLDPEDFGLGDFIDSMIKVERTIENEMALKVGALNKSKKDK